MCIHISYICIICIHKYMVCEADPKVCTLKIFSDQVRIPQGGVLMHHISNYTMFFESSGGTWLIYARVP